MLLDPLHPMVVHFPVVLVVILPIFAIITALRARDSTRPAKAWALTAVLAAALFVSAFTAVRTGQDQEDRVEEVVPRQAIHTHEEAGERFLVLSGALALVAIAGLLGGRAGEAARWVATAGSVALVIAGVQVGHSGGELVYRHGAASAYVTSGSGPAVSAETDGGH